jgi:hypothetical protein
LTGNADDRELTIANCQGLLNSGRRAHYRGNNDNDQPGPPRLHALYPTPARYSLSPTSSAWLYAEHVPLPCIKLDEQPGCEIVT